MSNVGGTQEDDEDIKMGSFRAPSRQNKKNKTRPSKSEPLVPIGTSIQQKFRLIEIIGAGGYGQILKAYWKDEKIHVAVKIMPKRIEPQRMVLEQRILYAIQNKPNFPYLFASGSVGDQYMFLVMELLGKSLSDLRKKCGGKRFDPLTAIRVSLQVLDALRIFHEIGYVHRDIKPGNLCVGYAPNTWRTIYLLDFGLSRKYKDTNGHVIKRKISGFRGTARYASINVHDKMDQTPTDDLISLFYTTIELSEGSLPWTKLIDAEEMAQKKSACKMSDMCKQQPELLYDFYTLCYETKNPDHPDYTELQAILTKCLPKGSEDGPMSYECVLGVAEVCPGSNNVSVDPTEAAE